MILDALLDGFSASGFVMDGGTERDGEWLLDAWYATLSIGMFLRFDDLSLGGTGNITWFVPDRMEYTPELHADLAPLLTQAGATEIRTDDTDGVIDMLGIDIAVQASTEEGVRAAACVLGEQIMQVAEALLRWHDRQ